MALTNFIGKAGELKVITYLRENGYNNVFVFENASGNGLDVVVLKKYRRDGVLHRYILSIEVKTTITKGSGPRPSDAQRKAFLNTGTILVEAALAMGRFAAISPNMQKTAKALIAAVQSGVRVIPLHVRLRLDRASTIAAFHNNAQGVVDVERVRMHSYTAPTFSKIYDKRLSP